MWLLKQLFLCHFKNGHTPFLARSSLPEWETRQWSNSLYLNYLGNCLNSDLPFVSENKTWLEKLNITRMGLENFHKTSWFLSSVNTFMPVSHYHLSSVAHSLSHVWLFVTSTDYSQASLSITNSWSLLKLMSIESVMPSSHLILYRPFLLLPSIFPASGSFPMSQFFTSGGQSIEASASASVLPMNIQDWFPIGLTGLIFLLSKGLSRVFFNTTVQKHQLFGAQLSFWASSHIHTWPLEKP